MDSWPYEQYLEEEGKDWKDMSPAEQDEKLVDMIDDWVSNN